MGDRAKELGRSIARWYLLRLLFLGILGPLVGAAVLTISPLSASDTAIVFSLSVALVLFFGLAAYFLRVGLTERRKPKSL